MEIADQLYGITMEQPGISKIISVMLRKTSEDNTESQAPIV